jgi:two-component system, LuxR family, response regulator FixJ
MGGKQRVYIVDDDEGVRGSLEFQLKTVGFDVRSFASGVDFLRCAETLALGCLILDVRMPEMDGPAVQNRLAELNLHFPVIMMTGHGDIPLAVRAMRAGAVDFLEKPFSEEAMLESIEAAQDRAARSSPRRQKWYEAAAGRVSSLSPREREVLEGLIAGLPNKAIAYDLGVSARTVESHRARVMDKMQARSLSELIRMALAAGIGVNS